MSVKVVADDGHYGIAEAYGSPSIGVKEQIQALKPLLVGKNPLEIDAIYTYMGIGGPSFQARGLMAPHTRSCARPAASRWLFGTWRERALEFPQPRCWAESSAIKSGYTTTHLPEICWTKPLAANGQKKSRQIPAALPRTRLASPYRPGSRQRPGPGQSSAHYKRIDRRLPRGLRIAVKPSAGITT